MKMVLNYCQLLLSIICILFSFESKAQSILTESTSIESLSSDLDGINEKPILRFGVIADVQYGDKDSRGVRHYRESLDRLNDCVEDLNGEELTFTIQLGDLIEGQNHNISKTHADLDVIMKAIEKLNMPVFHVIGNHDLRVDKEILLNVMGISHSYYDFTIKGIDGWRFVVLDGNDNGYGVMTNKQISWLNFIIKKASANNEKVVCFSHYALVEEAAENHRMYQSGPILKILDNSNCVVAWFAGHDHSGGYALRNGVHHITLKGMVEAPVENAYGVVELYSDRIRINGVGKEEDRELLLN